MVRQFSMVFLATLLGSGGSVGVTGERVVVYAVNYPLQYFAQRITGGHAEVVLPVPPDADPAFWRPDVEAIGGFQRADVILLNGAGYAKWVEHASLPQRKLVDTSAGFRDRYIEMEGATTHSHGLEGQHAHTGTAFTTWLDFTLAIEQARTIRDALSRLMPDQGDALANNFLALERDLLELDTRLKTIAAKDPAKPLLASHPVYQYPARRYSLNLKSVMWEPDTMPTEIEWQALAELREAHPAGWMLWERDPAPEIRQRLQQLEVQSMVFDPCANRPATGDFLSIMLENLAHMAQILD